MSNEITGPVDKVTNVKVNLGPLMIMTGGEVVGTADDISILVAEAKKEELEKLKAANEVRLVKMLGEGTDKILNELSAKETAAWDSLSKYKFIMFGYHAAIWVTLNRIHRCHQRNPFLGVVKLAKLKIEKRRYPEGRGQ